MNYLIAMKPKFSDLKDMSLTTSINLNKFN